MNKLFEISRFNPCKKAIDFRRQFQTFKEAWDACPRGDWMLHKAEQLGVDIRPLTLAKARCAETVKDKMEDERSLQGLRVAIAFGLGDASENDLKDAASAAASAADDADAHASVSYAYAAYAAYAAAAYAYAAYAAYAAAAYDATAYDAAYAAAAAAASAYAGNVSASAYAHAYADDAYAKEQNQMQTANICREILTDAVMEKINQLT
jgi:hypothetical protein